MKLAGYRLVDRYSTRDTAQDVAVNYAPSKIVKRREKWEVWTKQGLKKRNLFGFGKTVTHSTKVSSQAYEAGRRSGDTGQFRSWWNSQTSGGEKFSGKLKRHAEQRYRAGVESLWKEEKKAEAKASAEDAKTVQADVVEALIGQQFTKSAARAAVKRHYKSGDTFDSLFRKTIGSGKTSKMSANRKLAKAKRGSKTTRLQYKHRNPKASALEKRIDALLNRVRSGARLDAMQREMLKDKHSATYRRMSKQYMKDVRELERLQKQYRELHGIENPAKFDRCVSDVKKSLKKYKRPGNAYAICTKAGTRNQPVRHHGQKRVKSFRTRSGARVIVFETRGEYPPFVVEVYPRGSKETLGYWKAKTLPEATALGREMASENPKRSARARVQVAHGSRHQRKAPNKKSRNAKVVWSARQGKLSAQVTRSLSGYKVRILGGKRIFEEFPAKHFDEAVSIARLRLADTSAQNPKKDQDFVSQVIPGVSQADALARAVQRVGKGVTHAAKRTTRGVLKRFRGRRAKNPIATAQKMYEDFHGEPSKEILEIVEERHHHEVVAAVGQLVSLLVQFPNGKTLPLNAPGFSEKISNGRKFWEFDEKTPLIKRVLVTTSEDGKQLFLDGGDQGISNDELKKLGFTDRDIHDHMVLGEIKMITYRTQKSFEAKGREAVDFWHKFGSEGSKGVLPTLLYYPRSKKLKIAGGRYYIAPPDRSLGNVSPGIEG